MHRSPTRALLAGALLAGVQLIGCSAPPSVPRASPTIRTGHDLFTTEGAVACVERHAAEVGATILARGGNAVDAAVATAFALAVTWPPAGNVGGGGFLMLHEPDGTAAMLDFRETAPAAVDADLFIDEASGRYVRSRADDPWLCVGVPGAPRGLAAAHARYGRLPWRELLQPAVALARDGFVVDEALADWFLWAAPELQAIEASAAVFLDAAGDPPRPGDLLIQADLAVTLARLADEGAAAFYSGTIADLLVQDIAAHGGLMTLADLSAYQPVWREPLRLPFAGHVILAPPPPSSGGVALGQILGQLERRPEAPARNAGHLFVEAARRAFADRARFLGDPDHVDVPVEWLLSDGHLDDLARSIDSEQATPSAALGPPLWNAEGDDTTHVSVVDEEGRAVSLTVTLEAAFGGKAIAAGTGVLLNNELGDFNRIPGRTGAGGNIGTPPNLAGPGRRPLSSMTPVIVLRDDVPVLVTGSPGGRTIINTVALVVLRAIVLGHTLTEAVAAPRIHHQWYPDEVVTEADHELPGLRSDLAHRGHSLAVQPRSTPLRGTQGAAHSIAVDPVTGIRHAVGDWRRNGWASVEWHSEP